MQVSRDQFNTISESPIRELYGKKGGLLKAPLDLCIMQSISGQEVFKPVSTPGSLIGATIVTGGGGTVGTITNYDWPPANMFDVNPVTSFNLSTVPDVSSSTPPSVNVGDAVTLLLSTGVQVQGAYKQPIQLRIYPDISRRVQAYRVDFNQQLLDQTHGGRVVLAATGTLLGMLVATQNQPGGDCHALVYPAHLVG